MRAALEKDFPLMYKYSNYFIYFFVFPKTTLVRVIVFTYSAPA